MANDEFVIPPQKIATSKNGSRDASYWWRRRELNPRPEAV